MPHAILLVDRTASRSTTGPKISSRTMVISGFASRNTAGSQIRACVPPAHRRRTRASRPSARAAVDVLHHAVAMRGGDERPHLRCVVERIADVDRVELLDERFREAVDRANCCTRMRLRAQQSWPALPRARRRRGVDGAVEVAIVEDQIRRLAAELQRHAFDVVRRQSHHVHPDFGRAGERDLADERMLDDRFADDRSRAGHAP